MSTTIRLTHHSHHHDPFVLRGWLRTLEIYFLRKFQRYGNCSHRAIHQITSTYSSMTERFCPSANVHHHPIPLPTNMPFYALLLRVWNFLDSICTWNHTVFFCLWLISLSLMSPGSSVLSQTDFLLLHGWIIFCYTHTYTCITTSSFIHRGTAGCLHILWIIMLQQSWESRYCSEKLLSFPLDIFPEVRLLDRMVVLVLMFWGTFLLLSRVAAPIYIPNTVQGSPFLH